MSFKHRRRGKRKLRLIFSYVWHKTNYFVQAQFLFDEFRVTKHQLLRVDKIVARRRGIVASPGRVRAAGRKCFRFVNQGRIQTFFSPCDNFLKFCCTPTANNLLDLLTFGEDVYVIICECLMAHETISVMLRCLKL